MKEWQSRQGIEPPAQFFADVIAYLNKAFPLASLDRETFRELRPYLAQQWRYGQNAAKAAAATCSCDGKTIVPSPASQVDLPKRAALAPKNAQRGDVFGVEDLRERGALPRLRAQAEIAAKQVQHFASERASLAAGGKPKALAQVDKQLARWQAKSQELQTQFRSLAAQAPWSRGLEPTAPTESVVDFDMGQEAEGPHAEDGEAAPRKSKPRRRGEKRPRKTTRTDTETPKPPLVLMPFLKRSDGAVSWVFKGAPDTRLAFRRKDGARLSDADVKSLQQAQSPSLLTEFEERYFNSQGEAEEAAREVGQPITQVFVPDEIAEVIAGQNAKAPKAEVPGNGESQRKKKPCAECADQSAKRRGRKPKATAAELGDDHPAFMEGVKDDTSPRPGQAPTQLSLDDLVEEFARSAQQDEEKR